MSVLNSIKGKIVIVQQDISESLRSLGKVNSRSRNVEVEIPLVDNHAPIEQLSRYQKSWTSMHQLSEDLTQRAQVVDSIITNLFQYLDQQNTAWNQFVSEMSTLNLLVLDINNLKDKIVNLEGAFDEIELELLDLEDVCDQKELVKKKAEHVYQLKKYQQNKHKELEQIKVGMAKKHAAKVQKFEEQLSVSLRERQKVFDEAHREQMIKYMTTGQVDYSPIPDRSSSLADIEIEQDQMELYNFLGPLEDNEPVHDVLTQERESDMDDEYAVCILKDEDCTILKADDLLTSDSG